MTIQIQKSVLNSFWVKPVSAVAFCFLATGLNGCATSSLTAREAKEEKKSALVAIALSVHEGEAEEIHVVDSENNEKSLSLVRPTMHLANEDVYLYELDPSKTYSIKSLHKGTHRTLMDDANRAKFKVQPGTITYLCSYMLYKKQDFAEAVTAQASEKTGVAEALREHFPDRKFRFGYQTADTTAVTPNDKIEKQQL